MYKYRVGNKEFKTFREAVQEFKEHVKKHHSISIEERIHEDNTFRCVVSPIHLPNDTLDQDVAFVHRLNHEMANFTDIYNSLSGRYSDLKLSL